METVRSAFVVALLLSATSEAQEFVYPVGVPSAQPTIDRPNANGYKITTGFREDGHTGVDLANGSAGGVVSATGAGTVSLICVPVDSNKLCYGFGNVVLVRHDVAGGPFFSLYAHLLDSSVLVTNGQQVSSGQPIAQVGSTGSSTANHLHFAVKRANQLGCGYIVKGKCTSELGQEALYVDPLAFIQAHLASSPTTYQPANDAGVQDIWTTSVFSFTGLGGGPGGGLNNDLLRVGGWGDLYYSLLEFDLSTLPAAASKVELQLYMPQVTGVGTTALYLDQVTSQWDNWSTTGTGVDHLRLWWADRPTATPLATLAAPIAGQWYAIDITNLYNAWKAAPLTNFGVQLRPVGAGDNTWAEFVSSNSADTAHHPRLLVTP